jgi:transposase
MDALQVEFRRRIVETYLAGGVTQGEVAERFAVSKRSVQKYLAQWRATGSLEPLGHGGGRPRVVQGELVEKLLQAVKEQPDATLRELQDTCGIPGCKMNVHRALERLQVTLKKRP